MNIGIKVKWTDYGDVIPPESYNSNPSIADIQAYTEAVKQATVEHKGEIIQFINTFLCGTKAIIKGIDNKLYRVDINNLIIIEDYD